MRRPRAERQGLGGRNRASRVVERTGRHRRRPRRAVATSVGERHPKCRYAEILDVASPARSLWISSYRIERFARPRSKSRESGSLAAADEIGRRSLIRRDGVTQQSEVDFQTLREIHSSRCRHRGSPRTLKPSTMVRGEHLVMIARRRSQHARRHDSYSGMTLHDDATGQGLAFGGGRVGCERNRSRHQQRGSSSRPTYGQPATPQQPLAAPHEQPPPRRASESCRSTSDSRRNASRLAPTNDPLTRASSMTKSGTTLSAEAHPSISAGLSLTRRSR